LAAKKLCAITQALREKLSDGDWHNFDELVVAIFPVVRPELLGRYVKRFSKTNDISEYVALRHIVNDYIRSTAIERTLDWRGRTVAVRIQRTDAPAQPEGGAHDTAH
jgi:hypothetical protein